MASKIFFMNSDTANYGEAEWNHVNTQFFEAGIFNTEGADWNDFIDLKVEQSAIPAMSVKVGVGVALVEVTRDAQTFKIFAMNLAEESLAISSNAGGTNRVDAIIFRMDVDQDPNALMNNIATIEVVEGTGATALTDGAIQTAIGSDGFIRLANITVEPAETTILDADIEDTRTRVLNNDTITHSPSVIRFRVLAADPTGADLIEGLLWYNVTEHYIKYYNGTQVVTVTTLTPIDLTNPTLVSPEATATPTASKIPIADSSGKLDDGWIKHIFGGDGVDGVLNVTSGTTTIDLGNAAYVVKNYTSINISAGATLAFSNPHTNGTIIALKSQGNVTIAGTINASGMGAAGGAGGGAGANGSVGSAGYGVVTIANNGLGGQQGSGTTGGLGAAANTANLFSLNIAGKLIRVTPGGGGGGGGHGSGNATGNGGAGGRGGAGLIIEVAGALDFSGTINVSGVNGVTGTNGATECGGGGGGGGGAGGTLAVIYNSLTANTGTVTKTGGNGGDGGVGQYGESIEASGGGGSGGCNRYVGGGGGTGTASGNGNAGSAGGGTGGGSGGAGGIAVDGDGGGGGGGGGSAGDSYIVLNTEFY